MLQTVKAPHPEILQNIFSNATEKEDTSKITSKIAIAQ
jgi:hypothetical protein